MVSVHKNMPIQSWELAFVSMVHMTLIGAPSHTSAGEKRMLPLHGLWGGGDGVSEGEGGAADGDFKPAIVKPSPKSAA